MALKMVGCEKRTNSMLGNPKAHEKPGQLPGAYMERKQKQSSGMA